ncbi:MAG: hypothetical protein ACRDBP_00025 [Luteolibacter sp.]
MKLMYFVFPICAALAAGGVISAQDAPPLAPLPKIPDVENPAVGGEIPPPAPAPVSQLAAAAPPDVVASAVTAVGRLGDEVVMGRFQVAVERMNPMWKERTAKRLGGMAELERQLAGVAKQMVQQGISMISFKPQGQPRSFEVGPGKKVDVVGGEEVESLIFTKWMVLIPTATTFRVILEGETKPRLIESTGFQVAISDKGKNDWSFIDGSGLTVNDLRGLFATLPQDLQLPPVGKRETR